MPDFGSVHIDLGSECWAYDFIHQVSFARVVICLWFFHSALFWLDTFWPYMEASVVGLWQFEGSDFCRQLFPLGFDWRHFTTYSVCSSRDS